MGKTSIETLIEAVHDRDRLVRERAYELLRLRAKDATRTLMPRLRSEDADTRTEAFRILRRIGQGEAAVPTLTKLRFSQNQVLRRWAARALGKLQKPADEASKRLSGMMKSRDRAVRRDATRAIATVAHDSPAALRALLEGLTWSDAVVRKRAAKALGQLGSEAAIALPELKKALTDLSPRVRRAAAVAIRRIERKLGTATSQCEGSPNENRDL